jgi:hypothetical protein
MGQYATSGSESFTRNPITPTAMWPGDDVYVWGTSFVAGQPPTPGQIQAPNDDNVQFEAVAVDERSLAVYLTPRPGGGAPAGCIVQIIANGNPGVMEVDVQDAGIDADGAYQTNLSSAAYKITTWTQEMNVWTAWAELQPEGAKFISLLCITNPNGVSLKAKISYV